MENIVIKERYQKPLTNREKDILSLMCKGYTNAEISAQLGIKLNTIKKHVSVILGKLDANNRTHAVVIVFEDGIL